MASWQIKVDAASKPLGRIKYSRVNSIPILLVTKCDKTVFNIQAITNRLSRWQLVTKPALAEDILIQACHVNQCQTRFDEGRPFQTRPVQWRDGCLISDTIFRELRLDRTLVKQVAFFYHYLELHKGQCQNTAN